LQVQSQTEFRSLEQLVQEQQNRQSLHDAWQLKLS